MEESSDLTYEEGISHQLLTLKRQMETMKKQMNRVIESTPLAGYQFFKEILSDALPFNFKTLTFEQDGTTNLHEHLI